MIDVLARIFGTLIILILGIWAKKKFSIDSKHSRVFSGIFVYLTLPFAIINAFLTMEFPEELMVVPLIGFTVITVILIIAVLISKNLNDEQKKLFIICIPSYGFGSFALPFLQNVYGALAVILVMVFDLGNTIITSSITCSVAEIATNKQKVSIKDNAKNVIKSLVTSPPFITFAVMFVITYWNLNVPRQTLIHVVTPIANANGFIAIFMIGILIDFKMEKSHLKEACVIVGTKVFLNFIVAFILLYFAPFNLEIRQMLFIIAMSPLGQLSIVFVERVRGNVKAAAFINTLSIIVSIIIMSTAILIFSAS